MQYKQRGLLLSLVFESNGWMGDKLKKAGKRTYSDDRFKEG